MSASIKAKRPGYVTKSRWDRGDVTMDEHADPSRPLRAADGVQVGYHPIRGVRASQGGHDYLLKRGSIDQCQYLAADRYCVGWHGANRSGSTLGELGSARVPAHQQGCPTTAMLACAADIRAATAALGQGARILVHQVVIQGWTLGAVGSGAGEGDQITLGRLRAALDRLAEIWEIETA